MVKVTIRMEVQKELVAEEQSQIVDFLTITYGGEEIDLEQDEITDKPVQPGRLPDKGGQNENSDS